jgi:hypothetical protein
MFIFKNLKHVIFDIFRLFMSHHQGDMPVSVSQTRCREILNNQNSILLYDHIYFIQDNLRSAFNATVG